MYCNCCRDVPALAVLVAPERPRIRIAVAAVVAPPVIGSSLT